MTVNEIQYEGVHVVLVDQNLSMRRLMRSSLNTIGFQKITETRNMDGLAEILAEEDVDLLILDLDTETERVCQEIRNIRAGVTGTNAFVVIIALTWLPEKDVVHLTLTSGTDDVVTKPVSNKVMMERVENLVLNRKQFVVTSSYIGPERRTAPRKIEGDLPTITAPNTLRAKATGDESIVVSRERIAETMEAIHIQKVFRIANQIGTKTVVLIERLAKYRNTPLPRDHLHDLNDLVTSLNEHIAKQQLDKFSGISASTAKVMENILDTVVPTAKQLEILRVHSQAIAASVVDEGQASQLVTRALESAASMVSRRSGPVEQAG